MQVIPTRQGIRLVQHGVVLSEVRTTPGPTHSVFDVLAACIADAPAGGRIALLGFAAGGLVAPLMALDPDRAIDAVDLDRTSHGLFRRHCPGWTGNIRWHHAEAAAWLAGQREGFDLVVEDLSVPADGDVFKPDASWGELPGLIRRRLRPGGRAVFNLLPPRDGHWRPALEHVAGGFGRGVVIRPGGFLNRILVAGDTLPDTRAVGRDLRGRLREIRSRLAGRVRVEVARRHPACGIDGNRGSLDASPP